MNEPSGSTASWRAAAQSAALMLPFLWPAVALAHHPESEGGGFAAGLLHPVTGPDHVLAMLAVGVWGAQLGPPAIWLLPVTFPLVMACGGMLGLMGLGIPGVEVGIALSAIVLGVMVLGEARPPPVVAAIVVGFFAVFHGLAHGSELPPGASAILYSAGFVIATGCIHAVGIAIGLVHRWPAGKAGLRAAGGLIAVAGAVFLWQALT
jgi:urease accessory protein